MNANQIINMVIRMVTRRLINTGVNTGIDMVSRRGKSKEDMTPEDHARAQQGKELGITDAGRADMDRLGPPGADAELLKLSYDGSQ